MFEPYTMIFGYRWSTFTLVLLAAGLVSALWLIATAEDGKRGAVADVALAGLIGGLIVGRGLHVILHWQYFAQNLAEIPQLWQQGGLNWHGTLLGFLLVGWGASRVRQVDFRRMLAQAAPLLPLIALVGWSGCVMASCGYGDSVARMADYPPFMTWIAPDVYGLEEPRFAVQRLAIWAALSLFIGVSVLRFWYRARLWQAIGALVVWSVISFALAFLRGDVMPVWNGLRADQWLDVLMFMSVLVGLMWGAARRRLPRS